MECNVVVQLHEAWLSILDCLPPAHGVIGFRIDVGDHAPGHRHCAHLGCRYSK